MGGRFKVGLKAIFYKVVSVDQGQDRLQWRTAWGMVMNSGVYSVTGFLGPPNKCQLIKDSAQQTQLVSWLFRSFVHQLFS